MKKKLGFLNLSHNKYRITLPPAIIFLDAQGGELWRAMGEVEFEQVEAKLREFGV